MPLPEAPRTRGAILDKSAYGKKSVAAISSSTLAEPLKSNKARKKSIEEAASAKKASTRSGKKDVSKRQPKTTATSENTPIQTKLQELDEKKTTNTSRLRSPRSSSTGQMPRIFVLDTNVLLHDPTCLFRFQEHDIYLPMVTLEEIDNQDRKSVV